jgi:hypothetical protein
MLYKSIILPAFRNTEDYDLQNANFAACFVLV